MIHLVNGESTRITLQETSIPGEKYSIDDILAEGPIPASLQSEASWALRAEYLGTHFAISKTDYLAGNANRERVLRQSLAHSEVILWFEFDLHCQVNLLYFLNWYASRDSARSRLKLICPDKFP